MKRFLGLQRKTRFTNPPPWLINLLRVGCNLPLYTKTTVFFHRKLLLNLVLQTTADTAMPKLPESNQHFRKRLIYNHTECGRLGTKKFKIFFLFFILCRHGMLIWKFTIVV